MASSDSDQILKYGPMGHEHAPVRARFGVFRGIMFSPIGEFATAGWAQPYSSDGPDGSQYKTYTELFNRFGLTEGEDDDGFDLWDQIYLNTYLHIPDIQNASLVVSMKEQSGGSADYVARFPLWERASLHNREYQLPIDFEDPPVEGLNTPQQTPIIGPVYYEFKHEESGDFAIISYQSTRSNVKNQADLIRYGFPGDVEIENVFVAQSEYLGIVNPEISILPEQFYPYSDLYIAQVVPKNVDKAEYASLRYFTSLNAYNLGIPVFRESLEGSPPQDHSTSDVVQPTSFAVKRIKLGEGVYRDWILYSQFRVYQYQHRTWSEDSTRPVYVPSELYTWEEDIFAMECTVSKGTINLVYPKNKIKVGTLSYVDTQALRTEEVAFVGNLTRSNIQNSSDWAFNSDCTKMSAFRSYYEYKKTRGKVFGNPVVYENYDENPQLIEVSIESSVSGEPFLGTIEKEASFSKEENIGQIRGPYGPGHYYTYFTKNVGAYTASDEFLTIDSLVELYDAEYTPGELKPLKTVADIEFFMNEKSICKGQKRYSFDEEGLVEIEVDSLPVIRALDISMERCVYATHSCITGGVPLARTEILEPYVIEDYLYENEQSSLIWTESTTNSDKVPFLVGRTWYETMYTLEIPPMIVEPFIEPFTTILKSQDPSIDDLTLMNYAWVTPFDFELGFYTDPPDLIERLGPKSGITVSLGSLRRLT